MKNKNIRGIIALVLVSALSFGVIAGARALSHNIGANTETGAAEETAKALEELDTAGAENIEKAVKTEAGYIVTVKTKGYGGDIRMNVSFDADAKTVTKVEVLEQNETDGVGSRITEADFLSQFNGVAAPVYLPGMSAEEETEAAAAEADANAETEADANAETNAETEAETEEAAQAKTEAETEKAAQAEADAATPAVLNDGVYVAKTPEADASGYVGEVTVTVADGQITEVVWENYDAEGNKKSVLSENGDYVMNPEGLTWKEQAENLGAALVASQNLAVLEMNEEGKTDAVSGVSINIMGFVALAEDCLAQAAGAEADAETEAAAGAEADVETEADAAAPAVLNDGIYVAKTPEADASGYVGEVTVTVADGQITEVVWENYDAEGNKKSVLSENGDYVMNPEGLTWKEQAENLGAALVASQNLAALEMNEEGKTDAVSGVSINIMGFVALAEDCLAQAAGAEADAETEAAAGAEADAETNAETEATENAEADAETEVAAPADGTLVDAVSGATMSSTAAVKGINAAYSFLQTVK